MDGSETSSKGKCSLGTPASRERTDRLRELMQAANLASFAALQQRAGVSTWPLRQLRSGQAHRLRAETLASLAQALQISLGQLLRDFSPLDPVEPEAESAALRQECQRLQQQLAEQAASLQAEFRGGSLSVLESFLLQWPTAAAAAAHNPNVPAKNLLPLVKPVEQLLELWGLEPIGTVGAEVAYDPQLHELLQGQAQPGETVRVRYVGYWQGDRLLHRARVSPV